MVYWFPVAHRCELSLPGSYVRIGPFDGVEVVAYNDGNEIFVFDNRCPHRGARIFEQRWGVKKIVCPYHGWSRDNGEWKMPRSELYGHGRDFAPNLHEHEWCGDWLFAWVAHDICSTHPLKAQLGEFYEPLAASSKRIVACIDHHGSIWRCDWRVAVENALEDLHVPLVHRTSLNRLAICNEQVITGEDALLSVYEIGDPRMKRLLAAAPLGAMAEEGCEGLYFTYFLHPYAQLSSTCGLTYALQLWSPDGSGRTAFSTRTYAIQPPKAAEATYSAFCDSASAVNRQVFDEDRDICARVSWKDDAILGSAEYKVGWFRTRLGGKVSRETSSLTISPDV